MVLPWAAWPVGCLAKRKIAGLIPGQGTCLGCGPGSRLGGMWEASDQCFSLTLMFLSLSPSLPLAKENKQNLLKIRKINCHSFLKFALFYRYVITSFVWLMVSAEVLLCCAPVRGALRPSDWGEHAVYRQFAQWMVPDGEECRMSRITASRFNQRASLTPEELQVWGLGKNK